MNIQEWTKQRIRMSEVERFMTNETPFINAQDIERLLKIETVCTPERFKDILQKSLSIETLTLEETACLLNVTDKDMLEEMKETALKIKKKVYDNRIVTFAPLYMGNYCVNNCAYCGFRSSNREVTRTVLTLEEVKRETEILAGKIGHKRLITVYGEHPKNDVDYITDTIQAVYGVKVKARYGYGQIRRTNVNAPPFGIEDLKKLHNAGIGTYQVFQETYHPKTYSQVHPPATIKGNYLWRLYTMHRAMEAGIDDVGLGVLFGLYDWKFEVMGLVAHNRELEKSFGVGTHTISFPRIDPALGTPYSDNPPYRVSDEDFIKLMTVIRLAVPHTGMIITARETADMRRTSLSLGITQTDASTRIGVGGYSHKKDSDTADKQQFILGDTRSLEEVIKEFTSLGYITSFCTAGYRCSRTGKSIMELLKTGQEGRFCKLNAVLTFREWLDDFASEETRQEAEILIQKEISEIKQMMPSVYPMFIEYYNRTKKGDRDIYF
jgi:2-iminoacetate synthase